jgi:predicted 3-demethylubiquinone-9 3-methyltransferase (glyoxalase superfamily)
MQKKITTFLTFDGRAEEAVNFYTSIFENSKILSTTLGEMLGDEDAEKAQSVMKAMLQMSKIDIEGLRRAYEAPEKVA